MDLGWTWDTAVGIVGVLLIVEHSLIKPDDFSKLGVAFFTVNGAISILLYIATLLSTLR